MLRPHCASQDHLRLWRPLQSQNGTIGASDVPIISESDLERILTIMNVSWAQSTRGTYGSGLLVFHVFCDSRDISEELRCPASPILIISFIAACAGSYSGGTLANYVYAV